MSYINPHWLSRVAGAGARPATAYRDRGSGPCWIAVVFLLAIALCPADGFAFDYLEHLWFTDRACADAQRALAGELPNKPELEASYLALALVCPVDWERPYCDAGYKKARGSLNLVEEDSRDYSITLGDYSALADHVSRQGPVRNLPRARGRGLVEETLRWLTSDSSAGGVFDDVAEDACEYGASGDLEGAGKDADAAVRDWTAAREIEPIDDDLLAPLARSPLNRGPHDPAMKYSYDNPHYLDLVLRNHHHFGEAAFESWNGFHSAAVEMRRRRCEELIVIDADEAENLADGLDGWERLDWDDVPEDELGRRVCAMLSDIVSSRLGVWAKRAPAGLVDPVRERIASLREPDLEDIALADRVVANLVSLVFEGTSLHYLQDGLAGGHMRTIRSREALVEVRHDHDADNRDGVVAYSHTRTGPVTFVAWGDGYLLGRAPRETCDAESRDPEDVATCLLRRQRGILSAATRASILDWAHGGAVYDSDWSCEGPTASFVCWALPVAHAYTSGEPQPELEVQRIRPGTLPVPPPDFSYESLSVAVGYQPFDETPSLSLRFATFREIDIPAHWLTSWEARLDTRFGERQNQSITADVGFGFHYRFWARVTLDLVPAIFVGVRDFQNSIDFFAGAGPRFGITALPEGWVKIPIEFSFFLDQQFVLFSTDRAFFAEPFRQLPRVALGFGLAYMH